MSKILFLDIDGVFIPSRVYDMPNQTRPIVTKFDPGVVGMFNKLAEDGWKFVVHSSWLRSDIWKISGSLQDVTVKQHMINQGLVDAFHEDWCCKYYEFSGTRWLAIEGWRLDHADEVKEYWIIDDEPYPGNYRMIDADRVITTNFDEGLTYADYMKMRYDR